MCFGDCARERLRTLEGLPLKMGRRVIEIEGLPLRVGNLGEIGLRYV